MRDDRGSDDPATYDRPTNFLTREESKKKKKQKIGYRPWKTKVNGWPPINAGRAGGSPTHVAQSFFFVPLFLPYPPSPFHLRPTYKLFYLFIIFFLYFFEIFF